MLLPFPSFTPKRVWRLPECTPAGKIDSYRTLPVGAVPARLLRSGEYSIRGMFDLIGRVAFVGSRTLGE